MDLFDAIHGRRSCRSFSSRPVEDEKIMKIIEAGTWAPSPANQQPWSFIIIKNPQVKDGIRAAAQRKKERLFELSGLKWINRYSVEYLTTAPAMIAVIGDPSKAGASSIEDGGEAVKPACAAAVQNMLLAAHALSLGSVYFTMYYPKEVAELLGVAPREVIAVLPIGYPEGELVQTPRQSLEGIVTTMD